MMITLERYVVVGFREDGSMTTELVADRNCKKIPPARVYDKLGAARSFRTNALRIRALDDYMLKYPRGYACRNQDITEIRIAKVTLSLTESEWIE